MRLHQTRFRKGHVTIVICYVDDVIITGNRPDEIRSLLSNLETHFTKINELGKVSKYVGIEIDRDIEKGTMKLHQKQYIDKITFNSPVKDRTPKQNPLPETVNYNQVGDGTEREIRDKVGSYRFLADRTRPSILQAVGISLAPLLTVLLFEDWILILSRS